MAVIIWSVAIIALLVFLWTVSAAAKYAIKFFFFALSSIVFATVFIPTMFFRPRDPRNALGPAACVRAFCKFLGVKLKTEGLDNIVKGSGCVVLINHQSCLDLIVLACLWPIMDNCTVISKKEILYIQPFGLASWLWGTIFIDRGSKNALQAVNETGQIIRQRKARVLMFPEGTRNSSSSKLLPFKKGAFHLALASRVPIQPVAVCRYTFLKKWSFESGEIRIKILPAISTEGYGKDDIEKLIDKTYTVMLEGVDLVSGKQSENGYANGHYKTS